MSVEGTPCACRFNGNGERLQECGEHAASRIRLREAEDRCDEHVAAMVEVADVLDAADGETAMWAARRVMARVAELEQQCQKHDLERAQWNCWKAHILQRMASAARDGDDRFGEWNKSADEAAISVTPEDLVVAHLNNGLKTNQRQSRLKALGYRETCECWHYDTEHAYGSYGCMVPRCGCKAFVLKRSSL